MRHSVVISLLPWFCREHKTGIPFAHILYTSVTSCVEVPLSICHFWLCRPLNLHGWVYFDIMSQGWQVTALANLTNQKYMPHLHLQLLSTRPILCCCLHEMDEVPVMFLGGMAMDTDLIVVLLLDIQVWLVSSRAPCLQLPDLVTLWGKIVHIR